MRFALVVLTFLLLGPPIGGFLMMSPGIVGAIIFSSPSDWTFQDGFLKFLTEIGGFVIMVAAFSIIFGGVAAFLCGLWVAWKTRAGGFVGYGQVLIVGAIAGVIGNLVLSLLLFSAGEKSSPAGDFVWLFVYMAPLGAMSGMVCLALCRRFGLVANSRAITS